MMKHVKTSHEKEKKKRRRLSLPEEHREAKVVKMDPDREEQNGHLTTKITFTHTHTPKKSRGFHWAHYLERENAVAAPMKLFKDVSCCRHCGIVHKIELKYTAVVLFHNDLQGVLFEHV